MASYNSNTQHSPAPATLLAFANLQMAAEALYGKQGIGPNNNENWIENEKLISIQSLKDGNHHASRFTATQAAEFAENWEIVSHSANSGTGFSGTLFRAKRDLPDAGIQAGELVISFRSTEFIDDYARDNIATNDLEIKEKGWAFGQIDDMRQWFEHLLSQNLIRPGQQVSVTGYSLGGHLATAFNLLNQNHFVANLEAEESKPFIKQTFTFNGAGVGLYKENNADMDSARLNQIIQYFHGLRENKDSILHNEFTFRSFFILKDESGSAPHNITNSYHRPLQDTFQEVKSLLDNIDETNYLENIKKAKKIISPEYYSTTNDVKPHDKSIDIKLFNKKVGFLKEAIERIEKVAKEYQRIQTLNSGGEKNEQPYIVPLNQIDALRLDYQLAVILTADKYTQAKSTISGAYNVRKD